MKEKNGDGKSSPVPAPAEQEGSVLESSADIQESVGEAALSQVDHAIVEQTLGEAIEGLGGDKVAQKIKGRLGALAHIDPNVLHANELDKIHSNRGLIELLQSKHISLRDVLGTLRYQAELVDLQIELVKLQRWVQERGKRVAILFEGRDAAGKGGTIRRFTEHLNPRSMRVVALPQPTIEEKGQWYFQRYIKQLPNAGEIVFFDRSWYNRAVVEPVNKFCTEQQYEAFLQQVPEYEHMLNEDGITIIKFWFSISKEEQADRFRARRTNPLKQWKLSPIDEKAQQLWEQYTHYKELMFSKTHTSFSPWIIVKANNKQHARLESIRYVLNLLDYEGKESEKIRIYPDPNVVMRFHRAAINLD